VTIVTAMTKETAQSVEGWAGRQGNQDASLLVRTSGVTPKRSAMISSAVVRVGPAFPG